MIFPDEQAKCRCGRSTFPVRDSDSLRTCSKCGYLTSFCGCKKVGPASALGSLKVPRMSDRTRAVVGTAVLSSMGTLFVVTLFSSPFLAVFGLGFPLGLNAAFFGKWLKESPPMAIEGLVAVGEPQEARFEGSS